MRKEILLIAVMAVITATFFQSCVEDKCKEKVTYTYYEPIYLLTTDIRTEIQAEGPRELINPGKLYFYNNYVLINEVNEGIHIIDNQDPTQPTPISFIPIPGNVDMSVKDDILYADNYMDLVALKITNPTAPELVKRVEDVFNWYSYHEEFGYTVEYRRTTTTDVRDCNNYMVDIWFDGGGFFANDALELQGTVDAGVNPSTGNANIAGSMARFGISDDYLYCIDEYNLDVFDISNVTCPEFLNTVHVGWGIETIFPHGEHLFIGAEDGMYIFDNSNPQEPVQQSLFQHARACDPVYVREDRAFVTLRDGTECEGFNNQLDIVNIEDLNNPWLMRSHSMVNPHGLSVTPSNKMFLCEGTAGMKILDVSDSYNVVELGRVNGFDAYDAIALGENHVMVIGKDGFFQFDTTDPSNIEQLSLLPVQ